VFAHLVGDGVVALVIGVPCAAIGFLVARRQPRNPLGWLFLVIACCLFIPTVGGDYAYLDHRPGHHLPFAAAGLAVDQLWSEGLALLIVVILLFPDGRLPSRFWRWALRAWCAAFAVLLIASVAATAGALAAHPIRTDTSGGLVALDSPAGWFAVVYHGCLLVIFVLSVGFIGVFAGLVLLTTDVLSLSSPVAVAASTLAAAALFNPLRQRVQRVVDRRFNQTRYNAERTVAAFAARLKDAVDVTAVRDDLTSVVQQTLEPAHISLWIRSPA
jgi:hypothetical protein